MVGTTSGIIKGSATFSNADPHRPAKLPGPKAITNDYELFLKFVPDIIATARLNPWDDLDYRDVLTVIHEASTRCHPDTAIGIVRLVG